MCGIVGYVGHQPCGSILIDGLRRLEYRGYDSAGLAIYNGEELIRVRSEGKLANLERAFMAAPVVGTVGIAHTRWATHGRPVEKNAHPHRVGDIVVVHNGIIENYAELRAELVAGGAVFESETDTEVAAQLIAKHRGSFGSLHETVRFAISLIRGSYALVVLDGGNPDEIVAARQASPLVLGIGEGEQFAASDVPAIMAHTRNVIFLMDGVATSWVTTVKPCASAWATSTSWVAVFWPMTSCPAATAWPMRPGSARPLPAPDVVWPWGPAAWTDWLR
jgi:glucosamine--fructose-6-phosphate aminotransferase (isomerizing)